MKVTVLYGGPSAEREISLISGRAVIDGLKQAGHEVFPSDVSPTDLSGLDHSCDVVFPVLHGEFGESGELQEILEQRKLPFVGSGSRASRLGMDKVLTKQAWERADLPTPPYFTQSRISIEPHMVTVFHDPNAKTANDDAARRNFVEYGRRLEGILGEASKQPVASQPGFG